MAIIEATCPSCGHTIKLNDEKEFGFCSACGHKIILAEYLSHHTATSSASQQHVDERPTVITQTPTAVPSINITESIQDQAIIKLESMFTLCSKEDDFLSLRQRILSGNDSETDKAAMVVELDRLMRDRLKDALELEANLPAAKKEVSNLTGGCIFILILGIVIAFFFPIAFPIAAVLAIIAYIGGGKDRKRKKECIKAQKRLNQYRKQGYKI